MYLCEMCLSQKKMLVKPFYRQMQHFIHQMSHFIHSILIFFQKKLQIFNSTHNSSSTVFPNCTLQNLVRNKPKLAF